jgi:hypothetical protein
MAWNLFSSTVQVVLQRCPMVVSYSGVYLSISVS